MTNTTNTRTRFRAANWLAVKLKGVPYKFAPVGADIVPGLHPPAMSSSITVIYDRSSPKRFDGDAIVDMVYRYYRYGQAPTARLYIALERVDERTKHRLATSPLLAAHILVYPGSVVFESKVDVIVELSPLLHSASSVLPPKAIEHVQALLARYQAAPGPTSAEGTTVLRRVRQMVAESRGKAFARIPRKKEVRSTVSEWTDHNYKLVQQARRNGVPMTGKGRRIDYALARHMQITALRSPEMPPKMRNIATRSEMPNLYRGFSVSKQEFASMISQQSISDKGFMAFTRQHRYAISFGARDSASKMVVVVRLNVRDVPRGTPWVWFAGVPETHTVKNGDLRRAAHPFNVGQNDDRLENTENTWNELARNTRFDKGNPWENEVLLPPGTLHFTNTELVTLDPPVKAWGVQALPVHSYLLVDAEYTQDGNPMNRHEPQKTPRRTTPAKPVNGSVRSVPLFALLENTTGKPWLLKPSPGVSKQKRKRPSG